METNKYDKLEFAELKLCKYGWAPTNSQAKYFLGATENVQLCLADCIGRILKCGVSDMRQIRNGRYESIRFSNSDIYGGAVFLVRMYFMLNRHGNLIYEYSKLNFASLVFGIVLVGLEVGLIDAYKAGWQVSTASIVQSAFLAVALVFVRWLLYKEALTWNKLVSVVICLIGIAFINHK